MASGYPTNWEKPHQPRIWQEPKEIRPVIQTTDPFTALHRMLDPWTVGFQRHLDFFKNLEDVRINSSYPPYNIKNLPDDKAQIELAIAGFTKNDVKITYKENIVTVEGNRGEDDADYSHKGIAARNFVQKFAIADDVVVNSATMSDGLLTIDLERIIPEAKKEKSIDIH
jgi:molecular chaperone IbpA